MSSLSVDQNGSHKISLNVVFPSTRTECLTKYCKFLKISSDVIIFIDLKTGFLKNMLHLVYKLAVGHFSSRLLQISKIQIIFKNLPEVTSFVAFLEGNSDVIKLWKPE